MFENGSVIQDSPTVSSEELVAVNDGNVYTASILTAKGILKLDQNSLKNMIDANSDDEKEINNASPIPTSSDLRNILKR
ncbi:hypothetical protein TNCV_3151641 [Trichonephila clavipes]|nr:hypothetical protein TNCV_3151641 [Trichonephila clavipes]